MKPLTFLGDSPDCLGKSRKRLNLSLDFSWIAYSEGSPGDNKTTLLQSESGRVDLFSLDAIVDHASAAGLAVSLHLVAA
jgi:hypothetical protein